VDIPKNERVYSVVYVLAKKSRLDRFKSYAEGLDLSQNVGLHARGVLRAMSNVAKNKRDKNVLEDLILAIAVSGEENPCPRRK